MPVVDQRRNATRHPRRHGGGAPGDAHLDVAGTGEALKKAYLDTTTVDAVIAEKEADITTAEATQVLKEVARRLQAARLAFVDVVDFVAGQTKASPNAVFAGMTLPTPPAATRSTRPAGVW